MTTKRNYAVAVYPKPQTLEEKQFNLDGLTLLNILNGMSYEAAREQAIQDMKDISTKEDT